MDLGSGSGDEAAADAVGIPVPHFVPPEILPLLQTRALHKLKPDVLMVSGNVVTSQVNRQVHMCALMHRGAGVLPRHKTRGTITASHRSACRSTLCSRAAAAADSCRLQCWQHPHNVHLGRGLRHHLPAAYRRGVTETRHQPRQHPVLRQQAA